MSIRLTHDIFCDLCGKWTHCFVSGAKRLKMARKHAAAGDWIYVWTPSGYKDLCPQCSIDHQEKQLWSVWFSKPSRMTEFPIVEAGGGDVRPLLKGEEF